MNLYQDKKVVGGDFPTVVLTLSQQISLCLLCFFFYPNSLSNSHSYSILSAINYVLKHWCIFFPLNASSTLSCPVTPRRSSLFVCMSSLLLSTIPTIVRVIENTTVVNSGKPTIQLGQPQSSLYAKYQLWLLATCLNW